MIVFLDFDGVTHPEPSHSRHAFCRMPLIEEVLLDFPEVQIVVSSAWRLDWKTEQESVAGLLDHFTYLLRDRVVGVTPDLRDRDPATAPDGLGEYLREWECVEWMRLNRPAGTPYLMLDDRSWWFKPDNTRLMIVDCDDGYMRENEDELRVHLTMMAAEAKARGAGK